VYPMARFVTDEIICFFYTKWQEVFKEGDVWLDTP